MVRHLLYALIFNFDIFYANFFSCDYLFKNRPYSFLVL